MKYQAEYGFFCNLLHSVTRAELITQLPTGLDWGLVLGLADYQGLSPLLRHQLKPVLAELPVGVARELESSYFQAIYRQLSYAEETARLLEYFKGAGVKVIPLKGIRWTEELYPEPGLRTFADVDILIERKAQGLARQLLAELGYQPEATLGEAVFLSEHFHGHYYLPRADLSLELHWGLSHPRRVKPAMSEVWQRARWTKYGRQATLALSPADDILHLAMHIGSHGLMSRLIWFLDFALLLRKHQAVLDKEQLWQAAEAIGCKRALGYCLFITGKLCDHQVLKYLPDRGVGWRERLISEYVWRKELLFTGTYACLFFKLLLIDRFRLAAAFTGSRLKERTWLRKRNLIQFEP